MAMTEIATIYLRALDQQDIDRTHKWHNDPELYECLYGVYRHVSKLSEEDWIRRKTIYSPTEVNLAICLCDTGEHIGNLYLQNIDWIARHGELHIFIGDSRHRSKGFGSQAIRLALCHAFDDLGLQRLYLTVLEDNERAIRVYENEGFKIEGKLRRHAFKKGSFHDMLIMGVLNGEC